MEKNYNFSEMSPKTKSIHNIDKFKRHFRTYLGAILLTGIPLSTTFGQTSPAPQPIPYTQTFDSLVGSNPSLPAGWGGWKLAGSINDEYDAVESTDQAIQVGGNNTNAAGIFDMTGKLGFLSTTNSRISPVLSVDTSNRQRVKIKYKLNVQRVNSNRVMGVQLQYRIGSEGAFTPVTESTRVYTGAGTGTNTTGNAVLAGETTEHEVNLPNTVNFQPFVQFRWVVARLEGGSGENFSFSVDDVEVTGLPQNPELIPAQAPYHEDFEISNWVVNNGTSQTNRFRIATPTSEANGKLYISNVHTGDSSPATYTISTSSYAYAYKEIQIPADMTSAKVSFKWAARGEGTSSAFDAGRFFILPPNTPVPTNGTEISYSTLAYTPAIYNATLSNRTGAYQYHFNDPNTVYTAGTFNTAAKVYTDNFVDLSQYAGQSVKAVFYWRNDSSLGNAPGFIIDDFSLDYTPTCLIPITQAATNITGRTAQINWQGAGTNFEYYLSTSSTAPNASTTPTGTATTNSAVVTGLNPSTPYYAWVRQVCEGNERTDWSTSSTFTTGVTCTVPTQNTVTNISTTGATLNWTSGNQEFEYYLSTTNTLPTATTTPTGTSTTNSVAVTQLSASTTYYWWVRSSCGIEDGKSLWSNTNTFTTTQIPANYPFIEDFEANSTQWTILSNNTNSRFFVKKPATTTISSGNLTFANKKLFIAPSETDSTATYVVNTITYAYRDVAIPANTTVANVSFKWLAKGESSFDYGRFFIVPTNQTLDIANAIGNSLTALNNIYTFKGNTNATSEEYNTYISEPNRTAFTGSYEVLSNSYEDNNVDLSAVAGQTVRVVFYWRSDGSVINNPSLIIDDFKLQPRLECMYPSNITASNISGRTANISWDAAINSPQGYEYYYTSNNVAPTNDTTPSGFTNTNTISLSGLTSETDYKVWVRSVCTPETVSNWSPATTFRTLVSCPAPTALTYSNITTTSATLGWTSTSTQFEYILSTTNTAPTTDTTGTIVEGNSVTISNLNNTTTYYFWVRALCIDNDKSIWTAGSFQTSQIPGQFPYSDSFETSQWTLANDTQANKFYIGTPQTANGVTYADNKLFISDNGVTNTYSNTSSAVYAYRDIQLPEDINLASLSFDWILKGEGTNANFPYDYGRFFIMPTSYLPTAGTNVGYDLVLNNVNNITPIYSLNSNPVGLRPNLIYNPNGTYSGAFENIKHTFTEQAIDLTAYAGQTVRLVFFWKNDVGVYPPGLAIDNFSIDYAEDCLVPENLTTTNLTHNSIQLNWIGNSDTYKYYVSTSNVAPTTQGTLTEYSTVNVTDLTPATTYYWWIKAECSETATWIAGPSFRTIQIPQNYPFTDDFSTLKWNLTNGNQANKFYVGTPTSSAINFENDVLYISDNGTSNTYNTSTNTGVFAHIDVELPADVTTTQVKFNWAAAGESTYDYGRFFIVPTTYQPTEGTIIGSTITLPNQIYGSVELSSTGTTINTFDNQIDLSAYANQIVRLVFYWRNDASIGTQPALSIDNFCIGNDCSTDLSTANIIKDDFVYYPNPVHNELTIKGVQTIANIEVYNLTGQIVNSVKVEEKTYQLNTSKLTTGVYLVKVYFENGNSKTVKIIKK